MYQSISLSFMESYPYKIGEKTQTLGSYLVKLDEKISQLF